MLLYLATTNSHKIKEIQLFLKNSSLTLCHLGDFKNYSPPKETGTSFKENALIKSQSFLTFLKSSATKPSLKQAWVIGEDSGLSVTSLKGAPGVFSARYSPQGTDKENNTLLLKNLKGKTGREAHYTCVISCLSEQQSLFFEGELKGHINDKEKGENGFGYDPLFIPEGETKTLGELPSHFKNQVSHRSQALKQLILYLNSVSQPK